MRNAITDLADYLDSEQVTQFIEDLDLAVDAQLLLIVRLVRILSLDLQQVAEDILIDERLSYASYLILFSALYGEHYAAQGGFKPSELSELHGTTRPTASALIGQLEDEGLLERQQDQADRRQFIIKLTPAGQALALEYSDKHFRAMETWFSEFERDEIEILHQLLHKLQLNINKADETPS
jgi:DNA-binding MarR family transcriptional regulator